MQNVINKQQQQQQQQQQIIIKRDTVFIDTSWGHNPDSCISLRGKFGLFLSKSPHLSLKLS